MLNLLPGGVPSLYTVMQPPGALLYKSMSSSVVVLVSEYSIVAAVRIRGAPFLVR
jgi:hypothetical protein